MRRLLALATKVAISAVLLYFAFSRVDLSMIGSRLQQVKVAWLAALVLALAAQLVLVALRWRKISLQCGAPILFTQALRYIAIASFFNQTLPSTVGGDAARIWLVAREGAGWKAATYSVIVDRVIGLAVLVAIVVVCLPWLLELVRDPLGRASVLLVDGAGVVATMTYLTLGHSTWRWPERWWITRHVAGTAAIALKVLNSLRSGGTVVALSIAIHLLTVAAAWCAARAVGSPLEFGQALLLVPLVVLVATIPISIAGWGVREGAMIAAFGYAGLAETDGLIVSVLFGAATFLIGAAGGLIWILSADNRSAWAENGSMRKL
jgi:hypothetical protein